VSRVFAAVQFAVACLLLFGLTACQAHGGKISGDRGESEIRRDFSLKDLKGKTIRLSQHKDKVVLIAFWGTWCGPCQTELTQMQALWKKHRDAGFELLSICVDPPDTESLVRQTVRRYGYEFPVLLDQETEVANRYNPTMDLPFSVLLDRKGRVFARHQGFRPGDEKTVEQEIIKLLAR